MSVRFNGSTDTLKRTTSSPSTGSNAFTVMVWVKLISDRNDYSTVISIGPTDPSVCIVQTDTDGTSLIAYVSGSTHSTTGVLVVGTWAHVTITHAAAGGTYTVYLNGVSIGTFADFGALSTVLVEFGNDAFTEWADAEFRGGRAWTAELTALEILSELASTTVVKTASLFADWDMANNAAAGTDRNGGAAPLTAANLSDGASDPTIYSGGGGSTFPPVPRPLTSMSTLITM